MSSPQAKAPKGPVAAKLQAAGRKFKALIKREKAPTSTAEDLRQNSEESLSDGSEKSSSDAEDLKTDFPLRRTPNFRSRLRRFQEAIANA
ncbi:hypothetical protein H2199_001990 [Coniosporium tulheliwenetii]|uniref:Uncharacterized protein n=1 Tax=Coniosporium tulheliwenetii TaxID=3383036 RepID=A0ACC2ZHI1_9PEZI|nr:hypothetical protein H2199_001990 [Cladosporium sp. JES 115]